MQRDIKRFVDEAESVEGSKVTKAIFGKLEGWFKNYLKDAVKSR